MGKRHNYVFTVSIADRRPVEITFCELAMNGIDPEKLLAIVDDKGGRDGK
jgi:hypothetical protein